MKRFFQPNLENRGRIIRGVSSALMGIAGVIIGQHVWWLGGAIVLAAGFVLFEAVRGWCVLRACGIRTRW